MRRVRAALAPYLLVLPGGLWLTVFFAVPLLAMLSLSTQEGNLVEGFRQTFRLQNYVDAVTLHWEPLVRSLLYGLATTAAAIVIGFPLAYWIAFKGGRRKSSYLFLILLPFFVSFVIRTISWKFLLTDEGVLLGPLKDAGVLPQGFHVLATDFAVIAGLTYNFLPFMVLPIYVALERIDPRVIEAAYDLYASRTQAFLRVVFPLALPGVFAGVLMTGVPAASDFVNASVLGGVDNTMIGNVIYNQFRASEYPMGASLSFILMALMLLGIFSYARALGTEDVLEVAAR
ncbi:ABC transporter permease [Bailinhaonella thermotolerans]|uniref:ABC transporter permease n=1 Tax=Bailinhaonella thermotolerans TaxID=1070861 RepID=A0A3A4AKU8_9ACTN|nr:ABC transporter permease [Bailinhaonella thermotolerans]RJL21737.1 ABC transporter permease [Bailinhaonella thermotolerans]